MRQDGRIDIAYPFTEREPGGLEPETVHSRNPTYRVGNHRHRGDSSGFDKIDCA